jgi:hypothetical protein
MRNPVAWRWHQRGNARKWVYTDDDRLIPKDVTVQPLYADEEPSAVDLGRAVRKSEGGFLY